MESEPQKKPKVSASDTPAFILVVACVGMAIVLVCGLIYGWSSRPLWGSLRIGAIAGALLATVLKVKMNTGFNQNVEQEVEIALGRRKRSKAWYHTIWSFIHPLAFGSVTEYLHKAGLPLIPAIGMVLLMLIALYPEQRRLYDAVQDRLSGAGVAFPQPSAPAR